MNKRILLVLIPLLFLGLLGNLKTGLAASSSATVSLSLQSSREVVFKDIFIDVVVSNVANCRGWGFQLFYETNCLDVIDVTEGSFLKSFAGESGTNFVINAIDDAYNETHGLIWVYCFMQGTPSQPAEGNGVLATIEFRSTDIGTSHMIFYYPGLAYPVKLNKMDWTIMPCTATGANVDIVETIPLDISIDVGQLYFPGEQVQCYVMTTYLGISMTPTNINAILYNPTGGSMQLTLQWISTGFYKTTYTLPSDASSGTWIIVIEATYSGEAHAPPHFGNSFKTFLLSSTLNDLQMRITAIEGSTETVKTNTTPKPVDWTTIGLYVSLALLVSIAIVLVVLYVYLRARFRSETIPS